MLYQTEMFQQEEAPSFVFHDAEVRDTPRGPAFDVMHAEARTKSLVRAAHNCKVEYVK